MALLVVVMLLVVPFLELLTALEVADRIGFLPTLAALVALSALGVVVVRRAGVAAWRRISVEVAAGRTPERELLDGGLVLVGGLLLVLPGFLTAAIGLVLLLPPVRAVLRPVLLRSVRRRLARSGVGSAVFVSTISSPAGPRASRSPWGQVIGGSVVDTTGQVAGEAHAEVVEVVIDEPGELPPR